MTLREIFNSILDHPIEFEFDPWAAVIGAGVAIVVLILVYVFTNHYDGDNGWHV